MKSGWLIGGAVLALTSSLVLAQSAPEDPMAGLALVPIALLASVLGSAFATAAAARLVSRSMLGETLTLRGVLRETLAIFGRVIPAVLLSTLAIVGLALVMAATVVGSVAGAGSEGARSMLGVFYSWQASSRKFTQPRTAGSMPILISTAPSTGWGTPGRSSKKSKII